MNPQVTTDELASIQMDVEAGTRRLRRRRLRTWLVFGLVGLMMGAVWAVGIASSTATLDIAGATDADVVFGSAPGTAGTSEYAGLVSAHTALEIGFKGTWGKITADTPMFDVDLTTEAGTFFLAVYLNNNPAGWAALQLEFRQVNTTCDLADSADWAAAPVQSVMVVQNEDSWAVFDALTAGAGLEYCIGIESINKANDELGTYIKRPSKSSTPQAPEFIAILNRSA